jgi:hypothetical protein
VFWKDRCTITVEWNVVFPSCLQAPIIQPVTCPEINSSASPRPTEQQHSCYPQHLQLQYRRVKNHLKYWRKKLADVEWGKRNHLPTSEISGEQSEPQKHIQGNQSFLQACKYQMNLCMHQ